MSNSDPDQLNLFDLPGSGKSQHQREVFDSNGVSRGNYSTRNQLNDLTGRDQRLANEQL